MFDSSGGSWQAPSFVYGIFGLVLAGVVFVLGTSGIYDRARSRQADAPGSFVMPAIAFVVGWTSDLIGRRRTLMITGSIAAIVSYPLFGFTNSFWPALILAVGHHHRCRPHHVRSGRWRRRHDRRELRVSGNRN